MSTEVHARDDAVLQAAREVVSREAEAVGAVAHQIDRSFTDLVEAILLLRGKVITTGAGTSGIMADRLAHLLAVCGTPAVYLRASDALHGGIGSMTSDDLLLAISKGGSGEIVELTQLVVRRGLTVVAVTENSDSAFARAASSVVQIVTRPADADPGELIAMGSTLSVGAWGDALAAVLMRLRPHSWRDVVDLHPGGLVGLTHELPEELPPIEALSL
jgi:arabinose-5-phosphate isomerase